MLLTETSAEKKIHKYIYWVDHIKWSQCSFFRHSKACFREFREFLAGKITVHLSTLRHIKIRYLSPEGATKANDFLSSSIQLFYLLTTFTLKQFY